MNNKILFCSFCLFLVFHTDMASARDTETPLWKAGIAIIPYPQSVILSDDDFILTQDISISVEKTASAEVQFAAGELSRQLAGEWGATGRIVRSPDKADIMLTRAKAPAKKGEQAYQIEVTSRGIIVRAYHASGMFYGIQTLLRLIRQDNKGLVVKGMVITDWPDIPIRAVHYDTKHFQEKKEYVFDFIRTLASYKINMLIWEWEDKFAYTSHPEIGAPGAFTMAEMQEFTRYARRYHVQIVPLVQGLGHVSYILKHPEYYHLREIPSNNWGFCPLREGTYDLMNDLIKEAVEATPGSEYVHIGCDETYMLGKGIVCGCRERYEKEGEYALRQVYINRTAEKVKELKRLPIAWNGGYDPNEKVKPAEGLFVWGGEDTVRDKAALDKGFPLYIYDPNPGIEHLFLPYFYRENESGPVRPHLEESYAVLTEAALSGKFKGMISTSWNCSGVHNQIWMLRYIVAAEYSWNGKEPALAEFEDTYFLNYYGPRGRNIRDLFVLLNKASYYYMSTFERKVWHWGEVGKTHLPDLPRDDMEYDPFWNTEYADLIRRSNDLLPQMEQVLAICKENLEGGVKNAYDFELFTGLAKLFMHTANTCLTLSALENSIARAAGLHFDDNQSAYDELAHAVEMIEVNLAERDQVFGEINNTWEKSQFPRGMSTPDKKYLHARDQQRNFANRRPDLSFMICDEEDLGLEDYLKNLTQYMRYYKNKYLSNKP